MSYFVRSTKGRDMDCVFLERTCFWDNLDELRKAPTEGNILSCASDEKLKKIMNNVQQRTYYWTIIEQLLNKIKISD